MLIPSHLFADNLVSVESSAFFFPNDSFEILF